MRMRREEKDGKIQCITCKEWKLYYEFYIRNSGRPYSKCKKCHKEYCTKRQKENPTPIEQRRKWARKNYAKKWYQKDVHASTQDAKNQNVESTLTSQDWLNVVENNDYKCYMCGCELTIKTHQENTITLEHLTPLSKGGKNEKSNVAPACFFCNSAKRNKTLQEFKVMVDKWSRNL